MLKKQSVYKISIKYLIGVTNSDPPNIYDSG